MFKKRFSLPFLAVSLLLAILFTFQITFVSLQLTYKQKLQQAELDNSKNVEKLAYIIDLIENYCLYDVDVSGLSGDMAIKAFVTAMDDPYAYYYTPEEYASYKSTDNGRHSGLGITITDDPAGLLIKTVALGSPAEEKGILAGDRILSINHSSLSDLSYSQKSNLLLGKNGDAFVLDILRGEQTLGISVTRSTYESPSVAGRLLPDGKTGLVRIESFNADTEELFKEITSTLLTKGATRFVYDCRSNPGGNLNAVVPVLDYLLPAGTVVTLEQYNGAKENYTSDAACFDYPAVILVNGETASAGELFAACMRDYGAAILVGETTYGKGVAQSVFNLPDGSAIKFTTAKYYSPKTTNYDGVGLTPDITVACPEDLMDFAHSVYENDPQMQKAVAYLNQM